MEKEVSEKREGKPRFCTFTFRKDEIIDHAIYGELNVDQYIMVLRVESYARLFTIEQKFVSFLDRRELGENVVVRFKLINP